MVVVSGTGKVVVDVVLVMGIDVVELVLVVVGGDEGSNSSAPTSGALPIIRDSPSKSVEGSSGASAVPLSMHGEPCSNR